jgi:ferredoxin-NADP reductase
MALKTFPIRLKDSAPLSEFTRHFEFEVPGTEHFGFVPGQWLSLRAQNSGDTITRAYSLASAPAGNRFALCLNRVQEGFMSNYLSDLAEGAEVTAGGPFGNFILPAAIRDTILIATGTGIAPFRSMLQWLFADATRHAGRKFWLVFGNRTEKDIYYHAEFEQLAAAHSNFIYMPTLSRADEHWKGRRGYVQEHVRALAEGHMDRDAYICGLDKMVSANRVLLQSFGWDKKTIRHEKFD